MVAVPTPLPLSRISRVVTGLASTTSGLLVLICADVGRIVDDHALADGQAQVFGVLAEQSPRQGGQHGRLRAPESTPPRGGQVCFASRSARMTGFVCWCAPTFALLNK